MEERKKIVERKIFLYYRYTLDKNTLIDYVFIYIVSHLIFVYILPNV